LNNPLWALKEVYRVLKPGGILHIWVPNWFSPNAKNDPGHKHTFNVVTLSRLMRRADFRVGWTINLPHNIPIKIRKWIWLFTSLFVDELYLMGVKPE